MRINEKDCALRLTVGAAIRIEEICPEKDIKNMRDVIRKAPEKTVMSIGRIVSILSNAYAESERHAGRSAESASFKEVIDAFAADDLLFSVAVSEITDTFARDYFGKISAKPTKEGRKAQKKKIKRGIGDSLPWYLFFGKRHNMSTEDVLNTPFGEFQDLMTCDAIYHGFAEEVAKKKKLTQEEMLLLE